jgi:AraC-like DNA-binding protein
MTFFDVQEHELDYFHVKPMAPFCALLRRRKEWAKACVRCDELHLEEAKRLRDVHIYHCHSGLIEGVVPLYNRTGVYLGAMVFGQVRDPAVDPRPGWSSALRQRYEELPAYSIGKARDIGHLLKCVSESIIDRELIRYRNKEWAEKLKQYIEVNLSRKMGISALAAVIGRSPSFVAHHFEREFGKTPHQYILERRMREAKALLQGGFSVKATADKLGFYDAFHFSRTFKRFWKIPPRHYCVP